MNLVVMDERTENDERYLKNLKEETGENFNGFIIFRIGGNLKYFHEIFRRTFLIPEKDEGLEAAEKFLDDNQKVEKLIICSESAEFRRKIFAIFPLTK